MNLNCDICVLCATANFPVATFLKINSGDIVKIRQPMSWEGGGPQPPYDFRVTLYFTGLLSWSLEQPLYYQSATWLHKKKVKTMFIAMILNSTSVPGRLPCCDGGTKYSSLLSGNVGTSFTFSVCVLD